MPETETPPAVANKPRIRQRLHKPAPPIPVPDINEDAAERKRVLNVLAQRRYRELHPTSSLRAAFLRILGQRKRQSRLATSDGQSESPKPSTQPGEDPSPPILDTAEEGESILAAPASTVPPQSLDSFHVDFEALEWPPSDGLDGTIEPSATMLESTDLSLDTVPNDAIVPSSGTSNSSLADSWPSFPDLEILSSSSNSPSLDSYVLPINELALFRAMLRISTRLNAERIFELTSVSPFNLGTGPPSEQLPSTWQPTAAQLLVPHHPIVDLLPWPTSRDRMLGILSLPEEVRPPAARDSLALVNFAYDMDDSAEGVRIWGDDPYDEKSWEVGQVVFERWWFIFDRTVVERSNYWRRLRGAPPLRITAGPS